MQPANETPWLSKFDRRVKGEGGIQHGVLLQYRPLVNIGALHEAVWRPMDSGAGMNLIGGALTCTGRSRVHSKHSQAKRILDSVQVRSTRRCFFFIFTLDEAAFPTDFEVVV